MSNITTENKTTFFPKRKSSGVRAEKGTDEVGKGRDIPYKKDFSTQATEQDAKVDIPQKVKDFSKIKKAIDTAPDIDNSEKITKLKNQIQNNQYQIDDNAIAEKILEERL